MLVGLLVVAGLVGEDARPMWVTPAAARPGQSVTVHFQLARSDPATLTVERGDQTWLVQDDVWQEVDFGDGFYVGLTSPGVERSSTTITLPTSIGDGSYQVCTLPLEDAEALCASLVVS